jgi:hypothetical protein
MLALAPNIAVAVPDDWTAAHDTRTTYLLQHEAKPGVVDATTIVQVEKRPSHDDALRRLAVVRAAEPATAKYLLIAGWPAVEREALVPFQHPGEGEDPSSFRGSAEKTLRTETAVAIGIYVIRFQTLLQPGANSRLAAEALAIVRRLRAPAANEAQSAADMRALSNAPQAMAPASGHASSTIAKRGAGSGTRPGAGGSTLVRGAGEVEAAASIDGTSFVTDGGCGIAYSNNGGQMFTNSAVNWTGIPPGLDGDCTVTWGPSGNFYLGQLASNGANQYVAFGQSTDGGAHFNYLALAVNRSVGQPLNTNVDQPHIAADRWNTSASGHDLLYVVWHETGNFVSRVACSSDSGATWGAPVNASSGNFGFPRVAVGRDGRVYVTSRSWPNTIDIDAFSGCDAGLVEQLGFPQSIAFPDLFGATCSGGAVTGLDRCNDGNTLASPTIAVDDTDANHVYFAWAQANAANNGQVVMVNDFRDDGAGNITFGTPVAANGGGNAIRFMPWLSAWGGVAYTGWYDRRTAGTTLAHPNDATRYFLGSVSLRHGQLVAGPESDLMGTDDAQCASGWGGGTRELQDATQCTVQPQNAVQGGGIPKYGDYDGSAIGGGRLLNIWTSGTAPSDLPPAANHALHDYVVVTDLPSSFFVRDWTSSAAQHDGGTEPSIHADFYDTSDVWNQVAAAPEPLVNDWVVGDLPVRGAQSYALARVSRRAPAAPTVAPVTISADFLMADFGMGLPFKDLGTQMVTLNATDATVVTPGLAWTLSATASSHVCLAVQISAPGDPYQPPGLVNRSPGPGGTDPDVIGDNKKAQRNLLLGAGAGGAGGEFHAIVHNIERVRRDIVLQYSVDPKAARYVSGGTIAVVGGKDATDAKAGRFVLSAMAPGEERWIRVRFGAVSAPNGSVSVLRFGERGPRGVSNGFAIGYRRLPLPLVLRERLRTGQDVIGRLAAIARDTRLAQASAEARRLAAASTKGVGAAPYRALLKGRGAYVRAVVAKQLAAQGSDPFGVDAAFAALTAALSAGSDEAVAIADDVALQRLDADLTWMQRRAAGR